MERSPEDPVAYCARKAAPCLPSTDAALRSISSLRCALTYLENNSKHTATLVVGSKYRRPWIAVQWATLQAYCTINQANK
jgi:hypothetical protein